jgi:hypothetical protein
MMEAGDLTIQIPISTNSFVSDWLEDGADECLPMRLALLRKRTNQCIKDSLSFLLSPLVEFGQ